jgi:transposase
MDDSEKRIIKMYFEENKSQREIARIEDRSLRAVNKIIKAQRNKFEDDTEPKNKNENRLRSGDNSAPKAYALYEKGYSAVKVAIKLEIDAKEAIQYYSDYLETKGTGTW